MRTQAYLKKFKDAFENSEVFENSVLELKEKFGRSVSLKESGEIELITKKIVLNDFDLGRLKINWYIGDHYVKVHSIDNDGRDHAHPHVGEDGCPCYGDHDRHVYRALEIGLVSFAFDFTNQLVHQYREDQAYRSIEHLDTIYCDCCGEMDTDCTCNLCEWCGEYDEDCTCPTCDICGSNENECCCETDS